MKKLLFVANVAKEHVNKFHIPFIKTLTDNGWQVDVACVHDEDVPYCNRQYDMVYSRNTLSFDTLKGIVQLRKILKETQYDVIHCQTPTGGVVARVSSIGLQNKPVILYSAHGFHFYKGSSKISWLVFYPVEKILSKFTDCLITTNEEDYELASKRFYTKVIKNVHGPGVNVEKFKLSGDEPREAIRDRVRKSLSIANDDILLTYVAELIPNKNQLSLLDMLETLIAEYPNAKLMLVGPDHYDGQVQRKAQEMGLSDNVIFTGWRSDVPDLIAASDFAVPASKREGLGLNIIESMAGGIPVVAYDNRGHRDIIESGVNGYIVENGNYKEMASIISTLIKNSKHRDEIVTNAFLSIEKYDISSVLKELQKIYEEVVGTF